MDDGEQHLGALWLQREGHVAAAFPGDGELAGWIELGDPARHPVLGADAGWPLARSAFRQTSSKGAPTFSSISPAASHMRRRSLSVRYAQTRSMGPGSRRWIVSVVGSV